LPHGRFWAFSNYLGNYENFSRSNILEIYEKKIAKGAHRKPPKRKVNLFGGLIDIHTTDFSGKFSIVVWPWAIV
jgi:hypothetical protein